MDTVLFKLQTFKEQLHVTAFNDRIGLQYGTACCIRRLMYKAVTSWVAEAKSQITRYLLNFLNTTKNEKCNSKLE